MDIKHKYFLSEQKDIRISIRLSEQEFHKSHAPLYANHLFCNSLMMSKIENHLINAYPNETVVVIFEDMRKNQIEKLNNGAITCGYELNTEGKIDVEANYQMARYSKNAFTLGFDAINDDDEDDMEIINYPTEKRVYAIT